LYILLARAFATLVPVGDFAFRVNLFSALCAAAALGVAVDLLLALTRSSLASICGVVLLAVSHTFWRHAVLAEVYALYALALLIELRCLERFFATRRRSYLVGAALVNGLNIANHLLALLHGPAYVGVIAWALGRRCIRPRDLWPILLAGVIGAAPYWSLIAAALIEGAPLGATLRSALFGHDFADRVLAVAVPFGEQAWRTFFYFALNFPTPLLLLAPVGIAVAWREPHRRGACSVMLAIFGVAFVFAVRYRVPDQYVFFLPCYVMLPVWVAWGMARWCGRSPVRYAVCGILVLLPVAVYEVAPSVLARREVSIGVRRSLPYRDAYVYFIRPRMNGETSAARFCREALAAAGPDGLLIADSTITNPLAYVRDVQRTKTGVFIIDTADVHIDQPAVPPTDAAIAPFVVRGMALACTDARGYLPDWLFERYTFVAEGRLFRLVPRVEGE